MKLFKKNENSAENEAVESKAKKLKKIACPVLSAAVIIGCATGYFLYSASKNYFTTDNARVTAKLYSVIPATNGKLISWDVENGDLVEQDQVLGRQDTLPYIISPISGTVVKNDGAVNQIAAVGTPVAIIADTANLYIGANVEETDIAKIHTGQLADVTIDAYSGRTFKGQVTEIDPATQTYFSNTMSFSTSGEYTKVTQLIPIKLTIENKDNLPLVYGMNAKIKVHLK